jgi:hypothetical protein
VIVVKCDWDWNEPINNPNGVFSGVTRYNWWSELVKYPNIVQYYFSIFVLRLQHTLTAQEVHFHENKRPNNCRCIRIGAMLIRAEILLKEFHHLGHNAI